LRSKPGSEIFFAEAIQELAMTHATSVGDLQIEDYLRRLDAALRGIAP
jgi:hypothetical protein